VFAQQALGRAAFLDLALQVLLGCQDGPQAFLDLALDVAAAGLVRGRGERGAGAQPATSSSRAPVAASNVESAMVVESWLPTPCNPRLLDNPISANRISIMPAMFNNI